MPATCYMAQTFLNPTMWALSNKMHRLSVYYHSPTSTESSSDPEQNNGFNFVRKIQLLRTNLRFFLTKLHSLSHSRYERVALPSIHLFFRLSILKHSTFVSINSVLTYSLLLKGTRQNHFFNFDPKSASLPMCRSYHCLKSPFQSACSFPSLDVSRSWNHFHNISSILQNVIYTYIYLLLGFRLVVPGQHQQALYIG